MSFQLRSEFTIVHLDPELEQFQIETEGETFWIPIHLSTLGLNLPEIDWNLPGARCADEEHRFFEVDISKFDRTHPKFKDIKGKMIYQWYGIDECVIKINEDFMWSGEYTILVISAYTCLSPPHSVEVYTSSRRKKEDRIAAAETYLNQSFPGNTICLELMEYLDNDTVVLEDPVNYSIFIIKTKFLCQI